MMMRPQVNEYGTCHSTHPTTYAGNHRFKWLPVQPIAPNNQCLRVVRCVTLPTI